MKEKFIEFLKENGAYEEYKCERLRYIWSGEGTLEYAGPLQWVNGAFWWDYASSGHEYWQSLSDKWIDRLQELENGK